MMLGNQYKIVSELGSGGMGVVYQAVDVMLEREVAIKKLRSEFSRSPDVAQRFLREAKIQARLNHPNVTQLYTCLQQNETFYIVMEFVAGTPLNRLIPLRYQQLLPLMLQALDSLEYAHSMGVLHRDIKPDNLMITPGGLLKVMDFGIAHVLGMSRQTREKTIMGTLEYISPERVTGKDPDRRSDIYALGAVLFEALTGKPPFESASEFELLKKHLEAPVPKLCALVPDAPEFLEQAIEKALAKEPDQRFATCREMKDMLAANMAELQISVTVGGTLARADISDDLERCRRRVSALINSGDLDLAQRVLDMARVDYPNQDKLDQLNTIIGQQRQQIATGPAAERRMRLAQVLSELSALESKQDWESAREMVTSNLEEHPECTALRLAKLYLRSKNSDSNVASASA